MLLIGSLMDLNGVQWLKFKNGIFSRIDYLFS